MVKKSVGFGEIVQFYKTNNIIFTLSTDNLRIMPFPGRPLHLYNEMSGPVRTGGNFRFGNGTIKNIYVSIYYVCAHDLGM